MITTKDIIKYYTTQDLKEVSSRQLQIASDFLSLCRASFITNATLKLNTKAARQLKTSLKTLQNAFPGSWYAGWENKTVIINVPRELLHDFNQSVI
jgi:hypothetical protein